MRSVAVIPARYASTRFPGKPLAPILGRPMIAWVVEAALGARKLEGVWVATDHPDIARAARDAGARAVMTSPHCASGTDRVAEAARSIDAEFYLNLQGDEPLLDPADLDALVRVLEAEPGTRIATLSRPIQRAQDLRDPDVVKVVCDDMGNALYFSRAPIPFYREAWPALGDGVPEGQVRPLAHVGIYGFARDALLAFTQLTSGRLERAEKLEQLRALEAGWKIRVLEARSDPLAVDRPADVARVEQRLRQRAAGRDTQD